MGFFNSLGQRTEQLKQRLTDEDSYECLSCESSLEDDSEHCPHCGSELVVSRD